MQMDGTDLNEEQLAVVLDECLDAMLGENASLDDCIARYPAHSKQLKELLVAASQVNRFKNLEPSRAFRNRTRAELMAKIRSTRSKPGLTYKYALIFASLVFGFLTTGTALAQGALPGDRLYGWKLASERAWRWAVVDPVNVDIKLAGRRSSELLAVIGDNERSLRAQQEYQNAEQQLISEIKPENEERITTILKTHRKSLEESGIELPPLKENKPHDSQPGNKPSDPSNLELPSENPSSNH